jgi:hypothetical protein
MAGGMLRIDLVAGKGSGARLDVPGMHADDQLKAAFVIPSPTGTSQPRDVGVYGVVREGGVLFPTVPTDKPTSGGGGADMVLLFWMDIYPS